jgi:hypothetical protein
MISASTAVLFLARPGLFLRRSLPGFPPPGAGSAPTPSPCLGTGDGARKPQGTLGKNMENIWKTYGTYIEQNMDNIWKFYGKYMENTWTTYGKIWKIHGQPMEKIWKKYGKYMENLWTNMENTWTHMENYGKYMENIEQNIDNIWKFYGKYMENTWTNIHRVLVRPCWV